MITPFTSIGTIYSILLSDEKQRQIFGPSHFSTSSTSFHVGVSRQHGFSKLSLD